MICAIIILLALTACIFAEYYLLNKLTNNIQQIYKLKKEEKQGNIINKKNIIYIGVFVILSLAVIVAFTIHYCMFR